MRRVSCFSIALILAVIATMFAAASVSASSGEESQFLSKINAERAARGIPTLGWSDNLAQVARRHSQEMAGQNDLHHNGNLRNEVSNWQVLGENVGYGPSVNDLHQAFMNSPEHRANILDTDYTIVGIGTVWKDGTLWVTEDFERPMSAHASSPRSSSSSSRGSSSGSRSHRRPAAAARAAAPASPHRSVPAGIPVPAAPAPATRGSDDLTRLMVSNLLGRDDPAVGTIGVAEIMFADEADPANLLTVAFGPFARIVGKVNAGILGAAAK